MASKIMVLEKINAILKNTGKTGKAN